MSLLTTLQLVLILKLIFTYSIYQKNIVPSVHCSPLRSYKRLALKKPRVSYRYASELVAYELPAAYSWLLTFAVYTFDRLRVISAEKIARLILN